MNGKNNIIRMHVDGTHRMNGNNNIIWMHDYNEKRNETKNEKRNQTIKKK